MKEHRDIRPRTKSVCHIRETKVRNVIGVAMVGQGTGDKTEGLSERLLEAVPAQENISFIRHLYSLNPLATEFSLKF